MKKRIGSLLLILALCFTLLPTAVMAEESVDAWDGSVAESFAGGTGTEEDPYQIANGAQLAYLAQFVNTDSNNDCAGAYFVLTADIDLNGQQWEAIGKSGRNSADFSGTFDGQYHKIINLYHHYTGKDYTRNGLFGVVSGTVKNLLIIDADIVSNDDALNAGILADWIRNGTVENCYTSGKIENNTGYKLLGGLIGQCTGEAQVKGCGTDATVVSTFDGDDSDTVGGLIGQWENSTDDSLIADCWFGGSISCNNSDSAVAGILGANFDFYPGRLPGVVIKNCMVATKNITSAEPGNVTWISAVTDGPVTNCIWPDTPPEGVEMDNTRYPEYNGTYLAVVKLVLDPSGNSASPDPDFDQNQCGSAVSNFTFDTVLAGLNENAEDGITWVAGIDHPTFSWDKWHISADYTSVDAALAKVPKDLTGYTDSSVAALTDVLSKVDLKKSKAEQDAVDAMAKAIEDAVAALELKPTPRPSRPSSPSYGVSTPASDNGTVSVSPKNASAGTTVTVTVEPDSGYVLGDLRVTDKNGDDVKLTDQGNGKYTFTMPAGRAEVSADFVKETKANPFTDVPSGAYYYDAVLWAAENGVTDGVTATLFAPDAPCTRAQIVTFLWRAAGSPEPVGTSAFTDVPANAYYAKAVAWAVENGITTGTSDTTFSPDAPCTRGQSVTFLYRAHKGAASASANFTDVPAGAYYAAPVAWAVENGITNGTGKTTFSPDAPCTRAEIVTFLYRAK